jgi:hypothetical protein
MQSWANSNTYASIFRQKNGRPEYLDIISMVLNGFRVSKLMFRSLGTNRELSGKNSCKFWEKNLNKYINLTFVLCLVENIDFEKNDFKKTVLSHRSKMFDCLIHSVTMNWFENLKLKSCWKKQNQLY